MDSTRQLTIAILLTLLIVVIGTIGYMLIEGWNLFDAVYMTIITIAAVGYQEVHEISEFGRIFTIILIFLGASYFIYVTSSVVQFMVEGRIRLIFGRRRLEKKIRRLKDHYIVCGYGRIGRVLCRIIKGNHLDLVVIEKSTQLIPVMNKDDILYISGDAEIESNLIAAGIQRAKGLIALLSTDINNVFLVLTARQLNSDIYIMARASQNESKSKLLAAGANQVESPYDRGAISMAQKLIRPTVTDFVDFVFTHKRKDIQMEEIPVSPSSSMANVSLFDSGIRQRFNLIIIAIKKPDGNMLFNPLSETIIEAGDTVIAVGEYENLQKLEKILKL